MTHFSDFSKDFKTKQCREIIFNAFSNHTVGLVLNFLKRKQLSFYPIKPQPNTKTVPKFCKNSI